MKIKQLEFKSEYEYYLANKMLNPQNRRKWSMKERIYGHPGLSLC